MPSRRHLLGLIGAGATAVSGCTSLFESEVTGTDETVTSPGNTPTTSETPTRTTETGTNAVAACEAAWTGDPAFSFEGESTLGRAVPVADRVFLGADGGLLALTPNLDLDWKQPRVTGDVSDVTDGVVLTWELDQVVAAESARGEVLWSFEPPGDQAQVAWGPTVRDGTVYVAASQVATPQTDPETEYGRLYGLELTTGSESFVTDLSPEGREWVQPRYLIADVAGVFVTLDGGGLLGIGPDGTVRWRQDGADWYYRPARVEDVVLQPRSRSVVAVAADTGETRWENTTIEMHVTASGDMVYGAGGGGPEEAGTLAAVDAGTGRNRWETSIRGCGGQPVHGAGRVALPVGCRDGPGHLGLHDAETGCRYGAYQQSADTTPALATGHERLYASVGENRGRLLAFDLP